MKRFIFWVLALGMAMGEMPALTRATFRMPKAAAHAHRQDQMSYAKFTKTLLKAKPRQHR